MENKLIWKSQEQQKEELDKSIREWKPGDSRDGYILCAEGKFVYRNISYLIKVLRYFNHTNKFTPINSERISDKHVVVEYPEETKPLADLISELDSEFLYHDTLHSFNDIQTVEEQITTCHDWAKKDIDNLLDGEIGEEIDKRIKHYTDLKNKIKEAQQ